MEKHVPGGPGRPACPGEPSIPGSPGGPRSPAGPGYPMPGEPISPGRPLEPGNPGRPFSPGKPSPPSPCKQQRQLQQKIKEMWKEGIHCHFNKCLKFCQSCVSFKCAGEGMWKSL